MYNIKIKFYKYTFLQKLTRFIFFCIKKPTIVITTAGYIIYVKVSSFTKN
jgi:hypothetical protein